MAINPTIKLPELTQNWGNKLLEVKVKLLSHVQLFTIPWTIVYQASLSMGSSRQEYWSGLPFPSSGDLPDPRIEPRSPALQLCPEPPGRAQAKPCVHQDPGERSSDPQETDPDMPMSVQESPVEVWVRGGL